MDGDSSRQAKKQGQTSNIPVNDSDVLQPVWFRHLVQKSNGLDRFLLDYGYHFLLPFGSMLNILLFIEKII